MLEVLIALTVLSVGLLGLAYLQTWGIRFSQESFYRSQATTIAYEFMDRIRANALHGGAANVSLDSLTTGPSSSSQTTPCVAPTTAAIARQTMDKDCFFYRLKNTLPAGNGSVVQKETGSFISLEITVAWNDRGLVVANPNLASTAANADNTAAACDPPRKHSSDSDFTWNHSTDPDVCLQTQSWIIGI